MRFDETAYHSGFGVSIPPVVLEQQGSTETIPALAVPVPKRHIVNPALARSDQLTFDGDGKQKRPVFQELRSYFIFVS